jgi:hypothetical protein
LTLQQNIFEIFKRRLKGKYRQVLSPLVVGIHDIQHLAFRYN